MAKNLINSADIEVEVAGNNLSLELSDTVHNQLNALENYVVDSMSGTETNKSPSVNSVKEYTNTNFQSSYNLITDGSAVKTGRKIDGKDEYIKRFSFTRTQQTTQTISKDLGFTLSDMLVTDIMATGITNTSNWFNGNLGDMDNQGTYLNKISLLNSTNKIEVVINANFQMLYVNISYISKS